MRRFLSADSEIHGELFCRFLGCGATASRTPDNFFDAAQHQKDNILVLNDLGFLKTPRKQTW
jgi:hypothetical protein